MHSNKFEWVLGDRSDIIIIILPPIKLLDAQQYVAEILDVPLLECTSCDDINWPILFDFVRRPTIVCRRARIMPNAFHYCVRTHFDRKQFQTNIHTICCELCNKCGWRADHIIWKFDFTLAQRIRIRKWMCCQLASESKHWNRILNSRQ